MQQCLTANSNLFFEVELHTFASSAASLDAVCMVFFSVVHKMQCPISSRFFSGTLIFFNRTTLLCHLFYRSGLMSRVSRNLSSFIGILMICYSLHVENLAGFFFFVVFDQILIDP